MGNPWISYRNVTSGSLMVANYVGSGGNCSHSAWRCVEVDDSVADTGRYTSIAFDGAGNPWVAYQNVSSGSLMVARYVGSGGSCTDTAWQCFAVEVGSAGFDPAIAFAPDGTAWVSHSLAAGQLRVARFV